MKKQNKKEKQNIFKIISVVLSVISALAVGIFTIWAFNSGLIPTKYILILSGVITILFLIFIILLFKINNKIFKTIMCILIIVLNIFVVIGINYTSKTVDFISKLTDIKYESRIYHLMVLKDASNDVKALNNTDIAFIDYNDDKKALTNELKGIITVNLISHETLADIGSELLEGKVSAILVEEDTLEILEESDSEFLEQIKSIWSKEIFVQSKDISKKVDVTIDPFVVFISGIDIYGSISKVSRSDVNMLMVINPERYEILLLHIPRDFYVPFSNHGKKDKLTHTGIYGIDVTVKTLENYFGMDINYYTRVNFTTLVELVDILGGIEVYSDYEFTAVSGHHFVKGLNKMDGVTALGFSRERKRLPGGDRQRGKDQQKVLEAIINKISNPSIISNYLNTLNVLGDSFVTNIGSKELKDFAKFELDKLPRWKVTSISVTGSDSTKVGNSPLNPKRAIYVMVPNEKSVSEAKTKIQEFLN